MTPSNKRVATILAGLAVVAAILLALTGKRDDSVSRKPEASVSSQAKTASSSGASRSSGGPLLKSRAISGLPKPLESPYGGDSEKHAEWIAGRVEELDKLSSFDDAGSLNAILAELGNSEPEIRAAALASVRSFGSRDAVPWLQKLSIAATDSGEKKALDEAIEYLQLPTVTEYLEENPDGGVSLEQESDQ